MKAFPGQPRELKLLRPVYAGDFCCDFKRDCKLLETTGDSNRRGTASSLHGRFEGPFTLAVFAAILAANFAAWISWRFQIDRVNY